MKRYLIFFVLSVLATGNQAEETQNPCKSYDYYGKCKECITGFWLFNGTCAECRYAVDSCEECSLDGKYCLKCEEGFFQLRDGRCGTCENAINMCKSCNQKGDYCFECIENWELYRGKCFFDTWKAGDQYY